MRRGTEAGEATSPVEGPLRRGFLEEVAMQLNLEGYMEEGVVQSEKMRRVS